MRLALGRLLPSLPYAKVPVLIVPTTSVNLQSINDFAHMLDVGQDVFAFQVTPPLAFQRTPNSNFKFAQQKPADPVKNNYNAAVSIYLTQYDFIPQINDFIEKLKNLGRLSDNFLQSNNIPIIVVGRECFMWDEAEYVITGNFKDDGYTALYDDRIEKEGYSNLCVVSLEKFYVDQIALSAIMKEREKSDIYRGIYHQMAERVFLSQQIVHFLLIRMFRANPSENTLHRKECIMDLNLDGGLDQALATSHLCQTCASTFEAKGPTPDIAVFQSSRKIIRAVTCMTNSVRRIMKIEQISQMAKRIAIWVFVVVALALATNVIASVQVETSDKNANTLIEFYEILTNKPPKLALWLIGISFVVASCLLVLMGICKWITKGSKIEL